MIDEILYIAAPANAASMANGLSMNSGNSTTAPVYSHEPPTHMGILTFSTGTGTTGRSGFNTGGTDSIRLGGGKVRYTGVLRLPSLVSDGTNRYTIRAGINDNLAGDGADGVYFRIVDNVNAGKWAGVCRANSVESTVDTGVAFDNIFHLFEFEVNAAGTSVQFYVDGVATGAPITTNIPVGAGRESDPSPVQINKSLGTSNRSVDIDMYRYDFEFTSAR
jgi:hypothetical protein